MVAFLGSRASADEVQEVIVNHEILSETFARMDSKFFKQGKQFFFIHDALLFHGWLDEWIAGWLRMNKIII
jgi:hypothetical protein